jgi:3',5'-cyclic AMP phosphodiesterase CpdA
MIRLAHISDVHIGPLPPINPVNLTSKRLVGYNSWIFRRRGIHDPAITAALLKDIREAAPDHLINTGDLVNIALQREFINGASWLQHAGPPDWMSFVPGNHDAYVSMQWEQGMGLWGDYMTGDLAVPGARPTETVSMPMPYVRQRRNVALIGVSSAVPTRPGRATGVLGAAQLEALASTLRNLRSRGFFRLLMIHHPRCPVWPSRERPSRTRQSLPASCAMKAVIWWCMATITPLPITSSTRATAPCTWWAFLRPAPTVRATASLQPGTSTLSAAAPAAGRPL